MSSSLFKKNILLKLIRYKYGTFTAIYFFCLGTQPSRFYGCSQKNTFDMKRLLCHWRSAVCEFKTNDAMQMNSTKINSSVKRYQIATIGNIPDPLGILAITVVSEYCKVMMHVLVHSRRTDADRSKCTV